MATRQEIQAALDLIRFTNIAQDMFNAVAKIAKGEKKKSVGLLGQPSIEIDMNDDDIKGHLNTTMSGILGYIDTIEKFTANQGKRTIVENGLAVLGVSLDGINQDVALMKAKAISVRNSVSSATKKQDLTDIGQSIDADIPNLGLVRNS